MAYSQLSDLPAGQLTQLQDLRNQWEGLAGYATQVPDWMLLEMANATTGYQSSSASPISVSISGPITSLAQFGQYMLAHVNTGGAATGALTIGSDLYKAMPWAFYGLTSDQYQQQATTFATEYKKLTGQAIPSDQLTKAFQGAAGTVGAEYGTGALLTGSEYAQQLMNDANIKKTYGWVSYGMDFNQFQQQKLQMRQSFGTDLTDQQAVTQLQYLHAASGATMQATARMSTSGQQSQQSASQGASGSVIR